MKKHTTVLITWNRLRMLGACRDGIDDIRPLLPCHISTDPEENQALACKLADSEWAVEYSRDHVYWLAREHHISYLDLLPDGLILAGNVSHHTQIDAFLIAQWLAWVADIIATKAGR